MRRLTFDLDTWQNQDRSADSLRSHTAIAPDQIAPLDCEPQPYYTNVPAALLDQQSDLIDQLMGLAHTLGARRLEVQVRDAE